MNEDKLVEELNKVLGTISIAHKEYLIIIMESVKNAFYLGLDIGKSIKEKELLDK